MQYFFWHICNFWQTPVCCLLAANLQMCFPGKAAHNSFVVQLANLPTVTNTNYIDSLKGLVDFKAASFRGFEV